MGLFDKIVGGEPAQPKVDAVSPEATHHEEAQTSEVVENNPIITEELFSKAVEEAVAAKLAEVIPKAKKDKENELTEKLVQVEELLTTLKSEKQEISQVMELKQNVSPEFHDYVKFESEKAGISISEFVEKNPQFKVKVAPTYSDAPVENAEGKIKLSPEAVNFVKRLRQNTH